MLVIRVEGGRVDQETRRDRQFRRLRIPCVIIPLAILLVLLKYYKWDYQITLKKFPVKKVSLQITASYSTYAFIFAGLLTAVMYVLPNYYTRNKWIHALVLSLLIYGVRFWLDE